MSQTESTFQKINRIGGKILISCFFIFTGLIFLLYGLDGVIGADILPGASRGGHYPQHPSGAPIHTTGWEARIYGSIFVLFGALLMEFPFGLPISSWCAKKCGFGSIIEKKKMEKR